MRGPEKRGAERGPERVAAYGLAPPAAPRVRYCAARAVEMYLLPM